MRSSEFVRTPSYVTEPSVTRHRSRARTRELWWFNILTRDLWFKYHLNIPCRFRFVQLWATLSQSEIIIKCDGFIILTDTDALPSPHFEGYVTQHRRSILVETQVIQQQRGVMDIKMKPASEYLAVKLFTSRCPDAGQNAGGAVTFIVGSCCCSTLM